MEKKNLSLHGQHQFSFLSHYKKMNLVGFTFLPEQLFFDLEISQQIHVFDVCGQIGQLPLDFKYL